MKVISTLDASRRYEVVPFAKGTEILSLMDSSQKVLRYEVVPFAKGTEMK